MRSLIVPVAAMWDLSNVSSNGRLPAQHRDEEAKRAATNSRKVIPACPSGD